MTTAGCDHYFDIPDTGGTLRCRYCFATWVHEHIWVGAGIAGGMGIEDVVWSDIEQCGCGATREVA